MSQPNVFQLFHPIGGVGARSGFACGAACAVAGTTTAHKTKLRTEASRHRRMADSIRGWGGTHCEGSYTRRHLPDKT
ncbi:hypothetical protein GCM10009745_73670 [Kribbella yunnanensis]|uniref:Uncharacterized protein n=1 Tax=Kribbella yunnanensis TaxID=190194 RepID=A0ABP4UZQ0_9ACTN